MDREVAIVGVGQTVFQFPYRHQSLVEMVFEAATRALHDAGIARDEIDHVTLAASDLLDGRAISSMVTAAAAGAYLRDEIKIAEDSGAALALEVLRIASGAFDMGLLVSWSKSSEAPLARVMNLAWEPFFHRPLGLDDLGVLALQAHRYRTSRRLPDELAAQVAAKNRRAGAANPRAHVRRPVEVLEVLRSPWVWWPLRELEVRTESDGACALVVASAERARRLKRRPVWVTGMGWATDSYFPGDRALERCFALEQAAQRAYERSGIRHPYDELDLAEVADLTAYHELMACEALGLCEPQDLEAFVATQAKGSGTGARVNPSGGLLSTHPYAAAGVFQVCEAVRQLRGEAGPGQVAEARRALVHCTAGFAGQSHSVYVLEAG